MEITLNKNPGNEICKDCEFSRELADSHDTICTEGCNPDGNDCPCRTVSRDE